MRIRYPYLLPSEEAPIAGAFDNLFDTIETKEGDDGKVALFSRMNRDSMTRRLGTEEVNKIAVSILGVNRVGGAGSGCAVEVLASAHELPQGLKDWMQAHGEPLDDKLAVHWRDKSYLLADKMGSKADVVEAIFHEHYTHGGLRAKFGRELNAKLDELLEGVGGSAGVMRLAKEQGINLASYVRALNKDAKLSNETKRQILMEELLAHASKATGSLKRVIQEWVGAVRDFLRRHGFAELSKYGITDLAHVLTKEWLLICAQTLRELEVLPMYRFIGVMRSLDCLRF